MVHFSKGFITDIIIQLFRIYYSLIFVSATNTLVFYTQLNWEKAKDDKEKLKKKTPPYGPTQTMQTIWEEKHIDSPPKQWDKWRDSMRKEAEVDGSSMLSHTSKNDREEGPVTSHQSQL